MKKISIFLLALSLCFGLGLPDMAKADVQIDRGQSKSTAAVKFFIGRYGRNNQHYIDLGNNGNVISSGSTVVWDTVSNDGVSIVRTGTSHDGRVAGITMDAIPGSSRDTNAATDENYNNWGRVQCWGRFDEARWAASMAPPGGVALVSGTLVGTSAIPGDAGIFLTTSSDDFGTQNARNVSRDHMGFVLEATAAGDTNIDIFLDRC